VIKTKKKMRKIPTCIELLNSYPELVDQKKQIKKNLETQFSTNQILKNKLKKNITYKKIKKQQL
jgi:hypothetical protein